MTANKGDGQKYIYFRGTQDSAERVEFDYGAATCCVNADMLICGVAKHPCTNGDVYDLSIIEQLQILYCIREERGKVIHVNKPKSLKDWQDSGLRTLEDYLRPGDAVTEDFVEHFVNIMPPTTCRSNLVQSGEPFSHERDDNGHYLPTFDTFYKRDGEWYFIGWCFARDLTNRVENPDRLARKIADLEDKVKRSRKAEQD